MPGSPRTAPHWTATGPSRLARTEHEPPPQGSSWGGGAGAGQAPVLLILPVLYLSPPLCRQVATAQPEAVAWEGCHDPVRPMESGALPGMGRVPTAALTGGRAFLLLQRPPSPALGHPLHPCGPAGAGLAVWAPRVGPVPSGPWLLDPKAAKREYAGHRAPPARKPPESTEAGPPQSPGHFHFPGPSLPASWPGQSEGSHLACRPSGSQGSLPPDSSGSSLPYRLGCWLHLPSLIELVVLADRHPAAWRPPGP